jgi:hypothetical protein
MVGILWSAMTASVGFFCGTERERVREAMIKTP